MGIYKTIGIRKLSLQIAELVHWIRIYQLKKGLKIFIALLQPGKEKKVSFEKNITIYLRNNFSDVAIFKQVFLEQQYHLYPFPINNATKIIDAGANIGLAAIYFANKFNNAEIISIEPEENNFQQLLKNTQSLSRIHCEYAAIWGKENNVSIQNPDSLAASFIVAENNIAINGKTIPAITINSLLKKYNWTEIDIVKIDIEGAEKEVFANERAAEWLSKTKLLIIELHDNYTADCSKTFFKALEHFNYIATFHHENIFIHFNH